MEPCQAPFPTPWNLPFHPVAGIQTSILISESLVGRIVARTRQCAGMAAPPRAPAAAATDSAAVIVVFASLSELKLSQGAAMAGTAGRASTANRTKRKAGRVFIVETSPLVRQFLLKDLRKSTVCSKADKRKNFPEVCDSPNRSHRRITTTAIQQVTHQACVLARLE